MKCFIGGSGSTGSSLLANVLNRHSEIFCGPETYLFSKHQLFEEWDGSKGQVYDGKLRSYPWHRYSRVDLEHEAFGWEVGKIKELLHYANFIEEFADEFFRTAASSKGKKYWVEKTPSNVYGFKYLPEHFPNCFLIHTVRNPYDTIASLNRRGYSIFYATCLYLVNACVGLASSRYSKYVSIVYEDLVRDPEEVISALCDDLGVSYELAMLDPAVEEYDENIGSWNLSEHDVISGESVGSFSEASRFVQEEIVYTVNALRISPFYAKKYNCEVVDIPAICEMFGYDHYEDGGFMNIFQLNIDKSRDHLSRMFKGYPSTFSKYPVMFRV